MAPVALAVQIEIADEELAPRALDLRRGSSCRPRRSDHTSVSLAIFSASSKFAALMHREHRSEDLFLRDAAFAARRRR